MTVADRAHASALERERAKYGMTEADLARLVGLAGDGGLTMADRALEEADRNAERGNHAAAKQSIEVARYVLRGLRNQREGT